ncbi:glycoside hydrolase family 10 protein [Phormidesmis priestleyi]|uniref:glycoside hydrolase family 10 protein n=1 Tax=Phormidesmis priestleyi TaxID=268141 RepID=UPI00083A62BB|nr:family 10 glycosylhydrolase [Phormidesmis priestleyi]
MLNRYRWQFRSLCLFVSLLTFVGVFLSKAPPSLSQTRFADIQGHWAQPCIEALTKQKIINGYSDGTFRPNNPVTRAEYAVLLVNAFPGVVNATLPGRDLQFRDVPQSYWAFGAIYQAVTAYFFSGYPDKTFRPNQKIPRVQALVALPAYRSQKPVAETLATFTDSQAIPAYAKDAIAGAVEQRIVVNYPNVKQFNPNQPATRAEIAAFLCRALPGTANLVPEQYVAGQPKTALSEIRGVWLTNIDSDVMFSRDRLTKTVQELADANLNTLYPAVWNWGYTLYPSQTAKQAIGVAYDPRPEAVGLTDRDMLKEFVEQGHQRKLSVIPWFEFGFMAPADSELARLHPDWLTQRSDKTQVWQEGKYSRVWLNPFKPEVQTFISNLILELVNNYDIDGIQFDDHFGLPFEFGYDDFTVALYQKENAGKSPPANAQDPAWTKWRANKITAFMTQVFESIKARKNHVLISLSPNNYNFSYTHSLQDWRDWEQKGLLEELILQVYGDSLAGFADELMRPEVQAARSHIPTGVGILTGLKDRPIAFKQIQDQVQLVRDRQFAGVSFFFYETMWNLSGETVSDRRSAFAKLFSTPLYRPKFPPD